MAARPAASLVLAALLGVVAGCSKPQPPSEPPAPEPEVPVQAVAPPPLTPEAARQAFIDYARVTSRFPGLGTAQQVAVAELRVHSEKCASVGGVVVNLEERTWTAVIRVGGGGKAVHRGDFVLRGGVWVVGDQDEYECHLGDPRRIGDEP